MKMNSIFKFLCFIILLQAKNSVKEGEKFRRYQLIIIAVNFVHRLNPLKII